MSPRNRKTIKRNTAGLVIKKDGRPLGGKNRSIHRTFDGYPVTDAEIRDLLKWGGYPSVIRVTGVAYDTVAKWIYSQREDGFQIALEDKRFSGRVQVLTSQIHKKAPRL